MIRVLSTRFGFVLEVFVAVGLGQTLLDHDDNENILKYILIRYVLFYTLSKTFM
jgi:hypothetical protein